MNDLNQINENKHVPLLTKVFIWSIVFESLLFFIIGNQTSTGFSFTIGKFLQVLVFFLLIINWLNKKVPLRSINLLNSSYRYLFFYFTLSIVAAFVGMLNGSYILKTSYDSDYASSLLARFVRSASFRPIFEYLIFIYYFFYFVILPIFLIRNIFSVRYFFKIFKFAFFTCLLAGFADLFLQLLGMQVLPRDMSEGRLVGFRFHGLAGEPRDAFVYLFFALGIMNLKSFWEQQRSVSSSLIIIVLIAALLTQSASGLIGILIALILYLFYSFKHLTIKRTLLIIGINIIGMVAIALSIYSSQRLQDYVDVFSVVYESLLEGIPPPLLFAPQMVNVYPVWDLYLKVRELNFFPILLGNGFGSASVVNNNMGEDLWNELSNPHSQLVRLLYECGIIGTYFFVKSFVYPIQRLVIGLPKSVAQIFFIMILIIVGLNLSHRSTSLFIYLGMSNCILRIFYLNQKSTPHVQAISFRN
jgi:hypothetical protein